MEKYWIDGQEVSKVIAEMIERDNQNIRKLAKENPDYREMKPLEITVSESPRLRQ